MSIKHIIQALVAVALAAAVATSCEKSPERIPVLELPSSTIGNAGTKQFITVASDADWTLTVLPKAAGEWITLGATSGSAGITDVVLEIKPNEDVNVRAAELVLSTASYPLAEEDPGKFASYYRKKIKQVGSISGNLPLWLELPAIDATEKLMIFGIHDMEGGKYVNREVSGVRNFSFYWDVDGLVSIWVAYPLNRDLYGTHNYDYLWRLDPILEENGAYQPDITEHSYGGYGWDGQLWNRGHQLARADRQLTQNSVMSTCYPTNITPQASAFNGGVWGKLEIAVREKAGSSQMDPKKDTLYVVTGCTQEGSTEWTSDYYQRAVQVPSAYFKALLRKQGSNYSAVGFMLPHNQSTVDDGNYLHFIYSIDALETKLGYKLFPNLDLVPELDEAAIEAIKQPADPLAVFNAW